MSVPATTTGNQVIITSSKQAAGKAVSSSGTTPTSTTVSGVSSATSKVNAGYLNTTSIVLNMIYQFSPETTLNPYIGYGKGLATGLAGIGIVTTPTNTIITKEGNDTTYTNQTGDDWVLTSKAKRRHQTHQIVMGAEIRLDLHNTIDLRMVRRYLYVPNITQLYPVNGSPVPSVGLETLINNKLINVIAPIKASTTTIEIGLLYYG